MSSEKKKDRPSDPEMLLLARITRLCGPVDPLVAQRVLRYALARVDEAVAGVLVQRMNDRYEKARTITLPDGWEVSPVAGAVDRTSSERKV